MTRLSCPASCPASSTSGFYSLYGGSFRRAATAVCFRQILESADPPTEMADWYRQVGFFDNNQLIIASAFDR